jgi:hypothetical protein
MFIPPWHGATDDPYWTWRESNPRVESYYNSAVFARAFICFEIPLSELHLQTQSNPSHAPKIAGVGIEPTPGNDPKRLMKSSATCPAKYTLSLQSVKPKFLGLRKFPSLAPRLSGELANYS